MLVWFSMVATAGDALYRLHGRIFGIAPEKVASINLTAVALYKIGIMLFNLVSWIVLRFLV